MSSTKATTSKSSVEEYSTSISSKQSTTVKSLAVVKGNVAEDCGIFHLPNGDVYEGFFELKKKEKTIKAQGPGAYITAYGDKYSGIWEKDNLATDVKIEYKDNSVYIGDLLKWEYTGVGMYQFPDGTSIGENFKSNVPAGPEIVLIDPSNHKWTAAPQGNSATFKPNNHYYDWVCTDFPKSQMTLLTRKSTAIIPSPVQIQKIPH